MTFDDQISQAFDTLTERLRGEIDQEVQRRTAAAAEAVSASASASASALVSVSESASASGDDDAARERLADGFEAIDRARSLTEVLDTLITLAREESPRAEVWLFRGGRPHLWRAPGSESAADQVPPGRDEGVPLTIAGTTVAKLRTQSSELRTTNVALLARYASKSLAALTAFKTARALTERPDENAPAADEAEDDVSARRYARLLVSEIKLYHEPAVIDGRRDRDLVARLGGEITRARVMYEQRVPPHVRERADYFQDELVKTLANGDASLLEVRS